MPVNPSQVLLEADHSGPSVAQLKAENEDLKRQLLLFQKQNQTSLPKHQQSENLPLNLDEYARYGRQMIVPQVGFKG